MSKKDGIVDLFPYKIRRRSNFYFRDHPENIHPNSPMYRTYWGDFLKYVIEGRWINDEGTWVFMMPKMFTYINYLKVSDKKRDIIHPHLRDNEWIIFTYLLCCEGFSGFEGDEEYTCHRLVEKYEQNPDGLNFIEVQQISDDAKRSDGSYKKFIDPWKYLTRHYLLDNPARQPLGRALYENPLSNGMIFSARGVGKSYVVLVGDFLHELMTGGIKVREDRGDVGKRLLFGIGSAMAVQLNRSLNNAKFAYYNMPGQYVYKDSDKEPCLGPFYKRMQGSWEVGGELNHIVKRRAGTAVTQGSNVQMVALVKDRTVIGAGDRFRRIYIEEAGFQKNLIEVHAANSDSLKSGGSKIGSEIIIGTGGNMSTIKQPKQMFQNPEAYDIFGIPDYWGNPQKKVGLFIPKTYAYDDYKDENGNTYLELVYNHVKRERKEAKEEKDSMSYDIEIMFNPIKPEEMLRPGGSAILPKQEAQEQLNRLEMYDIFRKRAQIGKLKWDTSGHNTRVKWDKDMTNSLKPILDTQFDDNLTSQNKEGAVIIYEQPPQVIPDNLYWMAYDPAQIDGDAESFHSVLVYKHFYEGPEDTLYDTVVAEWIGRKETLEKNYEEVIKLAMYFNARVFPEHNVAGFIDYCKRNDYGRLLESDAYLLEQEIHGTRAIKRSYHQVGFKMNKRKKNWALKKLRDWLLEVKESDPKTGVPMVRTMDWIFSPRILNEIIEYTDSPGENFDHISSLLGLMLLIGKLEGSDPVRLTEEYDDIYEDSALIPLQSTRRIQDRYTKCDFLDY